MTFELLIDAVRDANDAHIEDPFGLPELRIVYFHHSHGLAWNPQHGKHHRIIENLLGDYYYDPYDSNEQ